MYGPGSRRRLPDSAFERGAAEGPPGRRASNRCSTCSPRTSAWCCRQAERERAAGLSDQGPNGPSPRTPIGPLPSPADATATPRPGQHCRSRPSRHPWLPRHAGPAVRHVFVERASRPPLGRGAVGHPEARRGATPRETERLGIVEWRPSRTLNGTQSGTLSGRHEDASRYGARRQEGCCLAACVLRTKAPFGAVAARQVTARGSLWPMRGQACPGSVEPSGRQSNPLPCPT